MAQKSDISFIIDFLEDLRKAQASASSRAPFFYLDSEEEDEDEIDLYQSPDCYYLLKVQLKNQKPPVWHRLVVHASTHFSELQSKILRAFNFCNDHLSSFFLGTNIGCPEICTSQYPGELEPDYEIGQILGTNIGAKLTFLFDFGDDWEFLITLEKILDDPKDVPARTIMHKGGPVEQYPDYDEDEDDDEWDDEYDDGFWDDEDDEEDLYQSPDKYYLLKVQLKRRKPPVWHRLVVHASTHFSALQFKILNAFEFENDHLSSFFRGTDVDDPEICTCEYPGALEPDYEIGQILGTDIGAKLTFLFDFGDNWEFVITLEKLLDDPKDLSARTVMHKGGHVEQYPDYDEDDDWDDEDDE